MAGEERGVGVMSIPDAILFPEAHEVRVHRSDCKMSAPAGADLGGGLIEKSHRSAMHSSSSVSPGKSGGEQHINAAPGALDHSLEIGSQGGPFNNLIHRCDGRRSTDEADARTRCLSIPAAENMSERGIGNYASLQDLLLGFTTGALCVPAIKVGPVSGNYGVHSMNLKSCNPVCEVKFNEIQSPQEQMDEVSDDQCSVPCFDGSNDPAQSGIAQTQSIDGSIPAESDNDNKNKQTSYNTDSQGMNRSGDSETEESAQSECSKDGNQESDNDVFLGRRAQLEKVLQANELGMESVDWDQFYSTGILVAKRHSETNGECSGNLGANAETPATELNGTWKKRRRSKIGEVRKECRMPRGMGPVERAMRQYCDKKEGHVFQPRVGMEFDSETEAFEFYNLYSWEVGFGIRKGNVDGNKTGFITVRDIVCVKQGYDKRTKLQTKRCYCKAMIRLHRTEDDGWFISSFIQEHNHELSATDEEKKEWFSHRGILQAARDMIRNLRDHNIQLSKVQCIMGSLHGSMENIPFTRRSLKIICAQIAREQRDDDMKKTLEVFRQMRREDPGFQFSVQVDDYNQTKALIWASGRSRSNYCCFGDVVTFDTTYCTNIYKMPFGLFVGVNNHFQTTIFAGVLMTDETAESFEWVFTEFLALMGGVHPQTILTDQCRAMEIALKVVMPKTTHLWCRWHVFRDARIELGPLFRKNNDFKDEFHKVITDMYTVDEFEHEWNALLKKYDLQSHHYMVKAYDKRERWAKCYNRGTFCARMTSTQRSESANHMLKTWVPRNSSMNRFVSELSKLLYQMYADEERAEHETKQCVRVNKVLWDVEKHALRIYTKKVYAMFSAEMQKINSYGVPQTTDSEVFIVTHTNAEYVRRYKKTEFKVVSVNKGEKYECACGLYEHFGVLCCHILRVFIHIGVSEIPEAHIMKRWTRRAKDLIPENLRVRCISSSEEHAKMHVQSQIYGKALEVARKGKYDFETCGIVMKYLQKAEKKVDEYIRKQEDKAKGIQACNSDSEDGPLVNYTSSDGEMVHGNNFGASGSCAGMSDEEVMNIKAPPRPKRKGAPVRKRYLSFLDKIDKKARSSIRKKTAETSATAKGKPRKKKGQASATKITPHCTNCRNPGHNRTKCPNNAPLTDEDLSD